MPIQFSAYQTGRPLNTTFSDTKPTDSAESVLSDVETEADKKEATKPAEETRQTSSIQTAPIKDTYKPFTSSPPKLHSIPSKGQFYWSEVKRNMRRTVKEGNEQYREALKEDEHTRLKAVGMASATAMGLTVFRRLRRGVTFSLMMLVLGKPIMVATQTFPKLSQAYEEVKHGNPHKGKAKFRDAMDESFYTIVKDFLKPISIGVMASYLLELPFVIRGEGTDMRHQITRKVSGWLHINRNSKPLEYMQQKMTPFVYWGDRQSNKLRKKFPLLNWIEEPSRLPVIRNVWRSIRP